MPITFLQERVTNVPFPYPSRIFHIRFNDPEHNLINNNDKIYSEVCISSIHRQIAVDLQLLNSHVYLTPSHNDIDEIELRTNFHPLFFDLVDLLRKIPCIYGYRIYNYNYIDIISGGVHGVGSEIYFINILEKFVNNPRNAYEYMKNRIYENSVTTYKERDSCFMLTIKNLTKPFKQLIINISAEQNLIIFDDQIRLLRRGRLFLRYLKILFEQIRFEHIIERIIISGCNVVIIFHENYENVQTEIELLKQILEYTITNNKDFSSFTQHISNHHLNNTIPNLNTSIINNISQELMRNITGASREYINRAMSDIHPPVFDRTQSLNRINRNGIQITGTTNLIRPTIEHSLNINENIIHRSENTIDMMNSMYDTARRRGYRNISYNLDSINNQTLTNEGIVLRHHEMPHSFDETLYTFRQLRRRREQNQNNTDNMERSRNTSK